LKEVDFGIQSDDDPLQISLGMLPMNRLFSKVSFYHLSEMNNGTGTQVSKD